MNDEGTNGERENIANEIYKTQNCKMGRREWKMSSTEIVISTYCSVNVFI